MWPGWSLLLRRAARFVAAYVICWHVALVTVLAWDGMLTTLPAGELAAGYVRSLPFLTLRSGSELAAYVQMLAALLLAVVTAAYLGWREWGPTRRPPYAPKPK